MEPMKPMAPMEPMKPMTPMKPMSGGSASWSKDRWPKDWWPKDLGEPSSSGSQNGMRYAFFPKARRLLVETDGKTTTYNSGEHAISGVSQQSSNGSPAFTSQDGAVQLDRLERID